MSRVIVIKGGEHLLQPVTYGLAECFCEFFPDLRAYVANDILGEDHVYATDETGKPMFDLLVSKARKFVFLWYYLHPNKGMAMVESMKKLSLGSQLDYVVKYPNVPVKKAGWPSIIRYGKKSAGVALEKFIIKAGNPQLEEQIYSEEALNTYRSYDWQEVPGALDKILDKAKEMVPQRLKNHPDRIHNVRGYCLYAGCAYHLAYPHLGFGMRDVDVQVFFSPKWYTNTRCAFTRHCGIKEFGEPAYFGGKTRWLDLMWNSFHIETGDFKQDVLTYMVEMRKRSDRWATISQRPIYDLSTKELLYQPMWLKRLEASIGVL